MTIYRASEYRVVFDPDEVPFHLDPAQPYDDEDPADREVIDRWRRFMVAENVEQATAAPGERRNVRRPRG